MPARNAAPTRGRVRTWPEGATRPGPPPPSARKRHVACLGELVLQQLAHRGAGHRTHGRGLQADRERAARGVAADAAGRRLLGVGDGGPTELLVAVERRDVVPAGTVELAGQHVCLDQRDAGAEPGQRGRAGRGFAEQDHPPARPAGEVHLSDRGEREVGGGAHRVEQLRRLPSDAGEGAFEQVALVGGGAGQRPAGVDAQPQAVGAAHEVEPTRRPDREVDLDPVRFLTQRADGVGEHVLDAGVDGRVVQHADEVTRRHGAAIATATRALGMLRAKGLVEPLAGVGTVVRRPRPARSRGRRARRGPHRRGSDRDRGRRGPRRAVDAQARHGGGHRGDLPVPARRGQGRAAGAHARRGAARMAPARVGRGGRARVPGGGRARAVVAVPPPPLARPRPVADPPAGGGGGLA